MHILESLCFQSNMHKTNSRQYCCKKIKRDFTHSIPMFSQRPLSSFCLEDLLDFVTFGFHPNTLHPQDNTLFRLWIPEANTLATHCPIIFGGGVSLTVTAWVIWLERRKGAKDKVKRPELCLQLKSQGPQTFVMLFWSLSCEDSMRLWSQMEVAELVSYRIYTFLHQNAPYWKHDKNTIKLPTCTVTQVPIENITSAPEKISTRIWSFLLGKSSKKKLWKILDKLS